MSDAFPAVYATLGELQVYRRMDIRSAIRLNNSINAYARRAMGWSLAIPEKERAAINKRAEKYVRSMMMDGTAPEGEDDRLFDVLAPRVEVYRKALLPLVEDRAKVEREMKKLARGLSAWTGFAADVLGAGELGLSIIVGECGDLSNYPNPAKVWKRLGLAPYRDKAASTWRREGGLSAEEWTELGYNPKRRAEIYACIGDPLFRAQTAALKRSGGGHVHCDTPCHGVAPYRIVYDRRRARTAETHPDWTKAHSHNDALRVMTKAFIRDLWCAWNGKQVKTVDPLTAMGDDVLTVSGEMVSAA